MRAPKKPSSDTILFKNIALEVANATVLQILEQSKNVEEYTKAYLEKIIVDVVLLGLGISKDRWSNGYNYAQCNGYVGLLHSYIKKIAAKDVRERISSTLSKIISDKKSAIYSETLKKESEKLYLSEYERELHKLANAELKSYDEEVKVVVNDAIKEIEQRISVMLVPQVTELINSIDKSEP